MPVRGAAVTGKGEAFDTECHCERSEAISPVEIVPEIPGIPRTHGDAGWYVAESNLTKIEPTEEIFQ